MNKYEKAKRKQREKIKMDNEARAAGYKTWSAYCRAFEKVKEKYGLNYTDDYNKILSLVPVLPALPLLEVPA